MMLNEASKYMKNSRVSSNKISHSRVSNVHTNNEMSIISETDSMSDI